MAVKPKGKRKRSTAAPPRDPPSTSERELPTSLAVAWGLRERPGKGPRPGLSLDQIVGAAVRLAGAEGLAAVSMGRVAEELGAATMSLYRYVAAKEELLALMVDAIYVELPAPLALHEDWRAGLTRWTESSRAALLRHPWALEVPLTGPPTAPNQIAWMEHGLASLGGTALTEAEKVSVLILLSGFVRNEAMLRLGGDAAKRHAAGFEARVASSYGALIASLIEAPRFPALSAAIAAGALDLPDEAATGFTFGLARILDGIEALVDERADAGPRPRRR